MENNITVVPSQIKVKVCFIIPCLNNGLLMTRQLIVLFLKVILAVYMYIIILYINFDDHNHNKVLSNIPILAVNIQLNT